VGSQAGAESGWLNGKLLTELKHKGNRMEVGSGDVLPGRNTETLPWHVRMNMRKV